MKIEIKYVIVWGLVFVLLSGFLGALVGDYRGYHRAIDSKTIIVHTDFDVKPAEPDGEPYYPFLKKEVSDYICSLCTELRIDSDLVVAHLMVENPNFDPDAVNRNQNGSQDLGMFQLNDSSLYSTFIKAYWDIDVEFNPFNWKHNTFIACHFIQDLNESLKVQDDAIMAYNCGIGKVMNNKVPASTYRYLASVKNNLTLLKDMH